MEVSPGLVWFLLGIAFFVTEMIVPGFILFFFGVGAWCTAAALTVVYLSLEMQVIICMVTSLLSLFLLRKWFRNILIGGSDGSNDSVNIVATSSTGVVTEAIIPPGCGRIKYGGSFWKAEACEPIPENTVVEIIKRKGLIVQVRQLETEE